MRTKKTALQTANKSVASEAPGITCPLMHISGMSSLLGIQPGHAVVSYSENATAFQKLWTLGCDQRTKTDLDHG